MDNRDEIIRTQMDLISTLVNNNMKNLAGDIWGLPNPQSPVPQVSEKDDAPAPPQGAPKAQAPRPQEQAQAADAQQAAKDAAWIKGKKVVIWCFSAREFTESTSGWVVVPVTKK